MQIAAFGSWKGRQSGTNQPFAAAQHSLHICHCHDQFGTTITAEAASACASWSGGYGRPEQLLNLLPQRIGDETDVDLDQNLVSNAWRYLSFVPIAQRADTADFAIAGVGLMIRSI